MKQIKDNTIKIDTDKAWEALYARLEKDRLLPGESDESSSRKRKIPLLRIAAAAAVFAGIIISIFYFSQDKDNLSVLLQNKETSGTLVTTLEDGSTVYLAADASVSYPAVFDANQRKVKLRGNALFCVTKDEKRPFIVETDENITIEVKGTIFAVQSSPGNLFELYVKQGLVNVHANDNQTVVSVKAGEIVRFNSGGATKSKADNPQIISRFKDKLCFKDEKLNHIVQAINTTYGFPIVMTEKSLTDRMLTVTFDDNSVESMTELICLALNLEQINKHDTIFIRPILK